MHIYIYIYIFICIYIYINFCINVHCALYMFRPFETQLKEALK